MLWFKHYSNANRGEVLEELGEVFGTNLGYALYFRFVEYCCIKWDGISEPKFKVSEKKLRSFLEVSKKSLRSFSEVFGNSSENFMELNGNFYEVSFPKLLEVRHKDAFSSKNRPAIGPPTSRLEQKKSKEIRIKNKNTISTELQKASLVPAEPGVKSVNKLSSKINHKQFDATSLVNVMNAVPLATKQRWVTLYQDRDFLEREALKAFGYYAHDNPMKKPKSSKGWARALSSWFERSWGYQAKNTKGASSKEKSDLKTNQFWDDFLSEDAVG